jgi:hypothetical protein
VGGRDTQRRKPLAGEAHGVRARDAGGLGVHDRAEALRSPQLLAERRQACGLDRAPAQPRGLALGRWAQREAAQPGQRRPEPCSCWGVTPSGARPRPGHCPGARRTARKRPPRAAQTLQKRLRERLHAPVHAPQHALQPALRGPYTSDGLAGNSPSLRRLSRLTEPRWRQTVSRRRQDGAVRGEKCQKLPQRFPLVQPTLSSTYAGFQASAQVCTRLGRASGGKSACDDLWGRALGNHALYPALAG